MQPDYTPYLDDTLTRTLGNQQFTEDSNENRRRQSEAQYLNAVKMSTKPFYEQFGLPLGKGLKSQLRQAYLVKHGKSIKPYRLYSKMYRTVKGMGATKEQRAAYKLKRDAALAALTPEKQILYLAREKSRRDRSKNYYDIFASNRKGDRTLLTEHLAKMALKKQKKMMKASKPKRAISDDQRQELLIRLALAREAKKMKRSAQVPTAGVGLTREELHAYKMRLREKLSEMEPADLVAYELAQKVKRDAAKANRDKVKGEMVRIPDNPYWAKLKMKKKEAAKRYREKVQATLDQAAAASVASAAATPATPTEGGLMTARGCQGRGCDRCCDCKCDGGLMTARGVSGRALNARPAGGFLGLAAAASTALPIVLEGIKWIAKRIGERRAARGQGLEDGIWLSESIENGKPPRNARSFWRKVYQISSKEMPLHFGSSKLSQAELNRLVDEFIVSHSKVFFEGFRDKVLAKRGTKGELTQAEVLKPIVEALAEKHGVPEAVGEILSHPALQAPAGSGIFDTILGLVKNPAVQNTFKTVAKKLLPVIGTKVNDLIKRRTLKRQAQQAASSQEIRYMPAPELKTMPTPTMYTSEPYSEAMSVPQPQMMKAPTQYVAEQYTPEVMNPNPLPIAAHAAGLGPASADAFTRGGRMASRVYGMAKKMP